jgi:hypothetical protein
MGYFEHWMITIGLGGVLGVIGVGLRIAFTLARRNLRTVNPTLVRRW